jgi:hypothetical protein
MLPLVYPAAVGVMSLLAYLKVKKSKKGVFTPERKAVYETALNELTDPVALRKLADAFDKEGLKAQADMLRKRAALQELPDDVKAGRQAVFRQGMASTNIPEILKLADDFEKQGSPVAAADLRKHAAGLKAAGVTPPATPPAAAA